MFAVFSNKKPQKSDTRLDLAISCYSLWRWCVWVWDSLSSSQGERAPFAHAKRGGQRGFVSCKQFPRILVGVLVELGKDFCWNFSLGRSWFLGMGDFRMLVFLFLRERWSDVGMENDRSEFHLLKSFGDSWAVWRGWFPLCHFCWMKYFCYRRLKLDNNKEVFTIDGFWKTRKEAVNRPSRVWVKSLYLRYDKRSLRLAKIFSIRRRDTVLLVSSFSGECNCPWRDGNGYSPLDF